MKASRHDRLRGPEVLEVVDLPRASAREAHRALESRTTLGQIDLSVGGGPPSTVHLPAPSDAHRTQTRKEREP